MIVAFFILLNFFLAIVVDNFMLVKEDVKEFNAENNIWVDVWDIAESFWKYRKYKWPDRATVDGAADDFLLLQRLSSYQSRQS